MRRRALPLVLLLLTLAACGGPGASRVFVLGFDGLDPQTVDLLMSEGKMPHFATMRRDGAYGRLVSQKPLLSPIIWTTIATGKGPAEHGIGHFVALASDGEELPASSRMRRVKALWNIASEAGKQVVTVGWWATWPPEEIHGAVVSDHVAYHFLFQDGLTGGSADDARTYPPELFARIAPLLRRPGDLTAEDLAPFVDVTAEELARPFSFEDQIAHFRWALATAMSYRDIGLELWRTERPDLELVYIEGTDSTSHLFGHLFRAQGLAGELLEQQRKFGRAVEQMYLFADGLLGEVMDATDENTTLLVLSDHGFELGVFHDDPSRTRDLRRVSEKFHREEGVLYLYGHRVRPGARLDRPSILDVAPTVLALLGLPPASDMPGRVLEAALIGTPDGRRIATYEDGGGAVAAAEPADGAVSRAQLEHLKSLGYLGGSSAEPALSSPQGDRNLAAIHFEAGRYREAAEIYHRLVETSPDDASLRASYAGTLGALGRYDDAVEQLDRAIELEPLNVEAYHNRAVIHERRGEVSRAVADYETAVRYNPQYEPSREALLRLTGHADVRSPANAAEAQAAPLVERASVAARRGDYEEAMLLLEAAEREAPNYVLIYQYRSNVAYLKGDRAAAVAALERALELEPDNALFRRNLEQLRATQEKAAQ